MSELSERYFTIKTPECTVLNTEQTVSQRDQYFSSVYSIEYSGLPYNLCVLYELQDTYVQRAFFKTR